MKFMNMIERVLGDNEGYSPESKKYYFEYVK